MSAGGSRAFWAYTCCGRAATGDLRRGVVGFGGVLFQSITFMAPAIATAFSIPIGMAFGGERHRLRSSLP
jgi:hypothetical protein